MSAQLMEFNEMLQEPVTAGCLSHHQAWRLMWDVEMLPYEPWSPGVWLISQTLKMFHQPLESMTRQ